MTITRKSLTTSNSGTWETVGGELISFISVKGANSFAVYSFLPGAASGAYDSLGLLNNGGNQATVSHISFWQTEVPEPTTGLLLGAAGLVAVYRRRKKEEVA